MTQAGTKLRRALDAIWPVHGRVGAAEVERPSSGPETRACGCAAAIVELRQRTWDLADAWECIGDRHTQRLYDIWNARAKLMRPSVTPPDAPEGGELRQRVDRLERAVTAETAAKGRPTLYCSFCAKSQHEVRKLIAGPDTVFVCNECVVLCMEILIEEQKSP